MLLYFQLSDIACNCVREAFRHDASGHVTLEVRKILSVPIHRQTRSIFLMKFIVCAILVGILFLNQYLLVHLSSKC